MHVKYAYRFYRERTDGGVLMDTERARAMFIIARAQARDPCARCSEKLIVIDNRGFSVWYNYRTKHDSIRRVVYRGNEGHF